MNYRNRDLLDLAYSLECQIRVPGVCEGGPGEPAHSNQHWHGKGGAMKAHDCFFASACRACHREIDQGSRLTQEQRNYFWQRGFEQTLTMLWRAGLIRVDRPTARPEVVVPEPIRKKYRVPAKIVPRSA